MICEVHITFKKRKIEVCSYHPINVTMTWQFITSWNSTSRGYPNLSFLVTFSEISQYVDTYLRFNPHTCIPNKCFHHSLAERTRKAMNFRTKSPGKVCMSAMDPRQALNLLLLLLLASVFVQGHFLFRVLKRYFNSLSLFFMVDSWFGYCCFSIEEWF